MTGQQEFQSTLSARRATDYRNVLRYYYLLFQSTLSARRATAVCGRRPIFFFAFQSTLSARRATITPLGGQGGLIISIHALREESDISLICCEFGLSISIHALREESDYFFRFFRQSIHLFQSTLSARRATPINNPKTDNSKNFNPRSPRGERLNEIFDGDTTYIISIHALREESDCLV